MTSITCMNNSLNMFDCMLYGYTCIYIFFTCNREKTSRLGLRITLNFRVYISSSGKQTNKQTSKPNHFRSFFILRYENIQNIYESKVNDYRV